MQYDREIDIKLIDPGEPRQYSGRRSWGEKKTIKVGRIWHVLVDGEVVGSILYRMFTREQRTPGKMYVNSRWESPGWTYGLGKAENRYSGVFHRSFEAYSKKDAIERILREHDRALREDATS